MNKIYKRYIKRAVDGYSIMESIMYGGALGSEYRDAWPIDIFVDSRGMYVLFSNEGALFRTYPTVTEDREIAFSEPEQIIVEHVPIESRTRVFRVNGELRFIAVASTAVLNRQNEIDTTELYDGMVDRGIPSDEGQINFYHIDEEPFQMGQVAGIARIKEFLITWGTIDETTMLGKNAERALSSDDWGLSIEFIPLSQRVERIAGAEIKQYTDGIFVGLAVIKESDAASYFTKIKI